ncbi:MAG: hypothetical protein HY371_04845, partial [Devosia nanyangense]|nr:hypothetical protein [Devosia nanyangense]
MPALAHDAAWTTGATAPAQRSEVGAAIAGGKAYIIGDYNGATGVLVYDLAADAWSEALAFPYHVHHPMSVGLDGKIYVFGGYVDGWQASAKSWILDPGTQAWTPLADMPSPRAAGGAVAIDGKIYVVSGSTTNAVNVPTVEAYDPAKNTWTALAPIPTPR